MGRDHTVFAAWGSWVARFRWPVFAVALVAVVCAGVWGLGVFGQLSEGGYNDPGSESAQAAELIQSRLGAQSGDVVVIYTPLSGTIDNAVLGQRVENSLAALPSDQVSATASYWQNHATQYASADRSTAVAVLTLAGQNDADKLDDFRVIRDKLDVEGARTQVAGASALGDASATRSTKDLGLAEAVSLPIVLILLLVIFGSLVAAALPVLVGGCAVLGSLGVLHGIALHHDVNSFAVNVASLLGLGMAIDYGLFMVGRFREEQGFGREPADAVRRTVATAGRTVLFSATLLMIALAGLLLFPQGFLKSLAYGGLAAVALAALLSLTLLPALLAVLGPRVDKLPVRLPRGRNAKPAGTGWAGLSDRVLRVPVLVVAPIVVGLLVLAAPIRGVHFGENDERVLPAGDPARVAIETLKSEFPALSSVGVQVVLGGSGGRAPDQTVTRTMVAAIEKVPGITGAGPTGSARDVVVLTATLASDDPFSRSARDAVRGIRALRPPSGVQMLVGGATARNVDSLDATAAKLPLMIGLLVGATVVLMFLAFGSILLPIKAVVMSALSLNATFGVLVWIFQDGHGAGLLNVTPAPAEAGIVVLMAAVVFGLSTDYEVFLLSRMVEARTRGASTPEAVTTGLARTGRVISAAAILLIVVTGAFALSSVTTMRFVGVGMIVALLLDATVVRMLLVPAVLGLLGDAAWWAPGPLRRLQERAGLAEYAGEELFPTVSVGRHAAPDSTVSRSASGAAARHASELSPALSPALSGVVVDGDAGPWTGPVPAVTASVAVPALTAGPSEAPAAGSSAGSTGEAPGEPSAGPSAGPSARPPGGSATRPPAGSSTRPPAGPSTGLSDGRSGDAVPAAERADVAMSGSSASEGAGGSKAAMADESVTAPSEGNRSAGPAPGVPIVLGGHAPADEAAENQASRPEDEHGEGRGAMSGADAPAIDSGSTQTDPTDPIEPLPIAAASPRPGADEPVIDAGAGDAATDESASAGRDPADATAEPATGDAPAANGDAVARPAGRATTGDPGSSPAGVDETSPARGAAERNTGGDGDAAVEGDTSRGGAGRGGAGQGGAGQGGAGQGGAGQSGAGQSGAGQSGAGQSRAGQSGAGQSRAGQSRAGQSRAGQSRAGQSRAGQSRAGQSRAGRPDGASAGAGNDEASASASSAMSADESTGPAGPDVSDPQRPTVDSASRMSARDRDPDPGPDTTAVLEVPATVDLSTRRADL
jgi:trehalose monomycolate/heme transporter